MICMDLDGSLLKDNKTIDPVDIDYLNALSNMFGANIIATGRHITTCLPLLIGLEIDYLITNNGACIYNKAGSLIKTFPIDYSISREIIKLGKTFNLDITEYSCDNDIVSIVFYGELVILENLAQALTVYEGSISYHILRSSSQDTLLEIMDKNVSKWSAISLLQEKYFPNYKIIAFGDDFNDLEMLLKSNLGFAMKHSVLDGYEGIDRASLDDNNNSGIVKTLRRIFGGKDGFQIIESKF